MTEVIINLTARYAAAFGAMAINNLPRAVQVDNSDYNLEFYPEIDEDFENTAFLFEGNEVRFAAVPFVNNKSSESVLAPPAIMRFSKEKDLIETPINGSDNIVVERWGTQPWDIRIRGLLIDVVNRHYPESQIAELHRLFKYNNVVDVEGSQFADKEIDSIYFTGIEINPLQGFTDTVQFTLSAKSIAPVGFTLNNP